MKLENRLRIALERREFLMWYQPKVNAATGEIAGFEALMRWQDEESAEPVLPSHFIPVLEQTGLILDAGRQAFARVVEDCTTWAGRTAKVPSIAINISLMQLREDSFLSTIVDLHSSLAESGCALELELTESVVMDNIDSIISKLQTLRGLGVLISVDDFGTGYSYLAYISRLPIHALKMDRSFVYGMMQDDSSLTIVKTIISLAHSLNLKVVAEGVETELQAKTLAGLNCDELQGYLFGRPLPANAIDFGNGQQP
jgi:EAL domain-containing protein (putative c-di-GMP-specific phosphodiesterase class I)